MNEFVGEGKSGGMSWCILESWIEKLHELILTVPKRVGLTFRNCQNELLCLLARPVVECLFLACLERVQQRG